MTACSCSSCGRGSKELSSEVRNVYVLCVPHTSALGVCYAAASAAHLQCSAGTRAYVYFCLSSAADMCLTPSLETLIHLSCIHLSPFEP